MSQLPPPSSPLPPEIPPPGSSPTILPAANQAQPPIPPPVNPAPGSGEAGKPIHEQMMDKVAAIDLEKVKNQVMDAFNGLTSGSGSNTSATNPSASNKQEVSLGILLHLLPAVGLLTFLPFINLLLPLGFWLYLKRDSAYLNAHGKEVVNFHIGVSVVVFLAHWLCLGPLFSIAGIILSVIGTIRASEGGLFSYPLTLRLIK